MNKTFIVSSDDVINSYGFRVLTSGIDTSKFDKNPVGLFNHQRNDDWSTEYNGPIVQWKNLQKLKEGLQADAEFDTEDPKGKIIANKVEKGFLRGASVGIRIIETSEDPKLMLPGQKYPTVTRCELREISIVDIPANPNALALFDEDDNRIELNCEEDLMKLSAFNKTTESQVTNMFKLKLTAGLTALAAFFGLESGKEPEVELSDAQLTD
jgi:HK97 family phage prohead protease